MGSKKRDLVEIIEEGLADIQVVFNNAAEKSTGAAKPLFEKMRDAHAAEDIAITETERAEAHKGFVEAFDALYHLSFRNKDVAKEKEAFIKAYDNAQTRFYKAMSAW